MAEAGLDTNGAWFCAHRQKFNEDGSGTVGPKFYCPPEGCPKGYCALNDGWQQGEPSPRRCQGLAA